MKKFFAASIVVTGLLVSSASADHLKDSLNTMLNKKDDTPAMVDLSRMGMSKPKSVKARTRSSRAVVATVNRHKIIKRDADAYLSKRTNGQVKNFDLLPNKQRLRLIEEMSVADVASDLAKKELTAQEKTGVLTRVWMQKKAAKVKVTDADLQALYAKMKQRALASKSSKPIPEFSAIKNRMKMQMTEKVIIGKLMQGVDINVINANMIAGSIGDIYISIQDANTALNTISKGKATWDAISDTDRKNLLKMIAPSKLIEASLKKDLTKREKSRALTNYWMETKILKTKVSDKELKRAYSKIEKASKKAKSKKKLPPYSRLKQTLKMQIAKEKVIADIMKNANVKLK